MFYAATALSTVAAGFIHGVSGFGSNIIFMAVMPYFLGVTECAAIVNVLSLVLNTMMITRYHRYIKRERIIRCVLPAALFYIIGATITILIASRMNKDWLKLIFGLFLIILALYFMLLGNRVHVKGGLLAMFLCGFISGACEGMFGVGGPLMVLLFLAVTDSKQEYMVSISVFFVIVGVYNLVLRILRHIYTMALVPFTVVAVVGVLCGLFFGNKVVDRINDVMLRKIAYTVIGVSGVITSVTALLAIIGS